MCIWKTLGTKQPADLAAFGCSVVAIWSFPDPPDDLGMRSVAQEYYPGGWNGRLRRYPGTCWNYRPKRSTKRSTSYCKMINIFWSQGHGYVYLDLRSYKNILVDYVVYHLLRYRAEKVVLDHIDWFFPNRPVLGQMGPHKTFSIIQYLEWRIPMLTDYIWWFRDSSGITIYYMIEIWGKLG